MVLPTWVSLLLFATWFGGRVLKDARFPPILGQILVGILFGLHDVVPCACGLPIAQREQGAGVFIVALAHRVNSQSRAELAVWLPGVVVGNYVPHDSFAVLAGPHHVLAARNHPSIAHVGKSCQCDEPQGPSEVSRWVGR